LKVWDARTGAALACFSGHSSRLLSGMFSAVDDDVVMTGADDSTLCCWKISEHTNLEAPRKGRKKIVEVWTSYDLGLMLQNFFVAVAISLALSVTP